MTVTAMRLAGLLLAGALTTTTGHAESFASSASSAGSASIGSLSDSLKGSSNSSTGNNVAEGDYQVMEVYALAERPGMLRLRLQAPQQRGDEHALFLDLPQRAVAPRGIAQGDVVSAKLRPYGVEFARADTREPFLLLLADDWRGDLDPHAVTL